MIRSALIFAVLLFSTVRANSAGPPPIHDEILLDHGFRYEDAPYYSLRCAITTADSVVLFAYSNAPSIYGMRRTWSGHEIDSAPVRLLPCEREAGTFDLSGFDGTGWKLAYLSDRHGPDDHARTLWLRALDRETLASTTPDQQIVISDGNAIRTPTIVWTGTRHLVAWVDSSNRFRMIRVRPDMTAEDSSPISLAEGVTKGTAALSAGPRGGIVAWIESNQALRVQALDAGGLPLGSPVTLDTGTSWDGHLVDVCPIRTDWFIAWTTGAGIALALIDSLGNVLEPGLHHFSTSSPPDQGLAVAAADSTYILAYRSGYEPGRAVRITRHPDLWILEPIAALDGMYSTYMDGASADRRNLDLSATGNGFALLWNTWTDPPIARPQAGEAESRATARSWHYPWPVYSLWLSPIGDPLSPNPVMASIGSRPDQIGVHYGEGSFLAMISDEVDQQYLHTLNLGNGTAPHAPATRYRTPVHATECDWMSCDESSMRGMAVRSSGSAALVLYGYRHHHDASVGTWIDDSDLVADRVGEDGSQLARSMVAVEHLVEGGLANPAETFDAARGENSTLLAYEAGGYWNCESPSYVRLKLLNAQGTLQRTWSISQADNAREPTVAATGSRYLAFWLEGEPNPELRRGIADPAQPLSTIVGTRVTGVIGTQGAPYLVPGPGQVLCVFPSMREGALDYDIFAQRYDTDCALLDPIPMPICPGPGNQGFVSGVWDSNQYLITWCNTDPGSEALLGGRIGKNGVVCDTTGFVIQDGYKGNVSLASDEYGHVLAAYGGNRLRMIDDLVPVLDEEANWPGDPSQGDGSIPLRVGRIVPNPGLGRLHLDIDLPLGSSAGIRIFDAAGRRVRDCVANATNLANGWTWDGLEANGVPAPSGVYFFRVSTREWDVVRTGVLLR